MNKSAQALGRLGKGVPKNYSAAEIERRTQILAGINARKRKASKSKKPMTPQQAMNNFKLFTELSDRNTYEQYRGAVRELAELCLRLGIEGDDNHKINKKRK